MIGSSEIPSLEDTVETLGRCGETFYGYFAEGRLVRAVSYNKEDDTLDIHRLVVRPDHFRRGIGRSLMVHVEEVAGTVDRIIVSTGARNSPARRLYRSLGFREMGESEAVPGLWITSFEKQLGSARQDAPEIF